MDQAFDLKILGIVPGVFQCLPGQFSKIRHDRCADFASQDNVAFGCQHFAGHAGIAVKGQTTVQYRGAQPPWLRPFSSSKKSVMARSG